MLKYLLIFVSSFHAGHTQGRRSGFCRKVNGFRLIFHIPRFIMTLYGVIMTPQTVIMLFTRADSPLYMVILHCILILL